MKQAGYRALDEIDVGDLEFDLDAETMALVEKMAAEEQVTPFEMCAQLLRERVLWDGETEPVG